MGVGSDDTQKSIPQLVPNLSSGVTVLGTGFNHGCAVGSGGGIHCRGYNEFGQLGDGSTFTRKSPVPVSGMSSGMIAIAAGEHHTCIINIGGAMYCWGLNDGRIGDGTTTTETVPVQVSGMSSGVIAITAGQMHTCALMSSSSMFCWGNNDYGQVGDGTVSSKIVPVAVSSMSSGVIGIVAGMRHTCSIRSGGMYC